MAEDQPSGRGKNGNGYNWIITNVVIALAGIAAYLAADKLSQINQNQHLLWNEFTTINKTLTDIKTSIASVTIQMSSHAKEDDVFDNDVKAALQDHETRLRSLQNQFLAPPSIRR